MSIPSPCISLCQIDKVSKLCNGCWRTIEEIIAWSSNDDDAKKTVWLLIEQRKVDSEKKL
jgi:uncharacterized protein